jgi:hypothetical protein
MPYILGFLAIILGIVAEVYTFRIVHTFGHIDWAEKKLGPGGTYTAWRLMGIGGIVGGMLMLRYLPGLAS